MNKQKGECPSGVCEVLFSNCWGILGCIHTSFFITIINQDLNEDLFRFNLYVVHNLVMYFLGLRDCFLTIDI